MLPAATAAETVHWAQFSADPGGVRWAIIRTVRSGQERSKIAVVCCYFGSNGWLRIIVRKMWSLLRGDEFSDNS